MSGWIAKAVCSFFARISREGRLTASNANEKYKNRIANMLVKTCAIKKNEIIYDL